MNFMTIEELKLELRDANLPERHAYEIVKLRGNKDKTISKDEAIKIINNLAKAYTYTEKYEPKSLFNDITFTSEDLLIYIDNRFSYLKEKYKPYGLKVPFSSWEEARKWLRKESLEGILTTPRVDMPSLEGKPLCNTDIYMCYLIKMPYEKITNNEGHEGYSSLICNFSPFLVELHYIIDSLNDCTGIERLELLRYFICGIKPDFKRIAMLSYNFLHQFIKIQINTSDITKKEWLGVYELYRNANNKKHKKQLSKRMIEFSRLLETIGTPEKPDANYYRMLMDKWNAETGENIKEWRSIRQMHERIIQRSEIDSSFKKAILGISNSEEEKQNDR